jgi:protein gp37
MAGRFSSCGGFGPPDPPPGPFHGFATKDGWTGRVELIESELQKPLHWKKPRVVALNWMGDLFHESLPFEQILRVYRVIQQAYWHKYLILTKRSKRLLEFTRWLAGADDISAAEWPRQCALGVSPHDQKSADDMIPEVLATPAAMRFVSLEPILGAVDLDSVDPHGVHALGCGDSDCHVSPQCKPLDWVILGGESGPGARPMHPDWVRSVRDQCQAAGVPFFFKQWGEWAPCRAAGIYEHVQRVDFTDGAAMLKVGKRAAGMLLDGRTWDQMPEFLKP